MPDASRPPRTRTDDVAVVRPAGRSDKHGIATLEDLPASTRRLLQGDLETPERRHALVAVVDGAGTRAAVVGFVMGTRQSDAVHVLDLVVARSARRRGVGSMLVAAIAAAAVADGTPALTLEVRAGNDAARRLYERLGFQDAGVRPGYYRDGEDAHVLWHRDPARLAASWAPGR